MTQKSDAPEKDSCKSPSPEQGASNVVPVATQPAPAKYTAFTLSVTEHVATLVFNTPKRSNAMGTAFWKEFPDALKELTTTDQPRVLVISGEGDHFSSGIDLAMFKNPATFNAKSDEGKKRLLEIITAMQDAITALEKAPFPVIAAIHGVCLGAALDLAAACDFRYASKDAAFSIEEINIGLMADLGSLQRLPLVMPTGLVREMAFTGMRLSAERALSAGLVNSLFETKDELIKAAMSTAKLVASKSAKAVASSKKSLNYGLDHGMAEALAMTANLQVDVLDLGEIMAALSKMKPAK
jgi:enoyl-CoA hydratase